MISQTAEYALRAVAQLAAHVDEPQTAQQIAADTQVPLPYLSKVLQSLAREGVIHSQRGLHGGFTLRMDADELTVYAVVEAVDPLKRISTCPLGLIDHGAKLCPLHRRLDEAFSAVEVAFRATYIGELLRECAPEPDLCLPPSLGEAEAASL